MKKPKKKIIRNVFEQKRSKVWFHILLFIVVELLLLQGIFGRWPSIDLVTMTGVGHLVYYASIPLATTMSVRYRHMRHIWYIVPVIIHVCVHIIPTLVAHRQDHIRHFGNMHMGHMIHHPFHIHSYVLVAMGVMILIMGEYLLHRPKSSL